MAKSKKKNGSKTKIMQRSDIPFAQRLQMDKAAAISYHREDAARIALQIACVALNDTEGLGYQRLSRFAKRVNELCSEYWEDPEVEDYHLHERLKELGFIVNEDGHMIAIESEKEGEFIPVKKFREYEEKKGSGK